MKKAINLGLAAAIITNQLSASVDRIDTVNQDSINDLSVKATKIKKNTKDSVDYLSGSGFKKINLSTDSNDLSDFLNGHVSDITNLVKTGNINLGSSGYNGEYGDSYNVNMSGQVKTNGVFNNGSNVNQLNTTSGTYTYRPNKKSAITISHTEDFNNGEKSTFITGEHMIPGVDASIHGTLGETKVANLSYGEIDVSNLKIDTVALGLKSEIGNTDLGVSYGMNKVSGDIDGIYKSDLRIDSNNIQTFVKAKVGLIDATVWNTPTLGKTYEVKGSNGDLTIFAKWGVYNADIQYDKDTNLLLKTPLTSKDAGISFKSDYLNTEITSNSSVSVFYRDMDVYGANGVENSSFIGMNYIASLEIDGKNRSKAIKEMKRVVNLIEGKNIPYWKKHYMKKYGKFISSGELSLLNNEIVQLKKDISKLKISISQKTGNKSLDEIYKDFDRLVVNGDVGQFISPEIFESQKFYLASIMDENTALETNENKLAAAENIAEKEGKGLLPTESAALTAKEIITVSIAGIGTAIAGAIVLNKGGTPERQVVPIMGDVEDITVVNGGAINIDVSSVVTLTNGDPIIEYTLGGDALPTGLSFDTTIGILSGTSTIAGTYNFIITATDNDGASNPDNFSITILDAEVVPVMGDVVNVTVANAGVINIDVSSVVTLTNGDTITAYTLGGDTLPTGLSFNTTTGVLSGSSSATGVYNFNVTATDNDGESNTDNFSITIESPEVVPVMGNVSNATIVNGGAVYITVSSSVTLTNGDPITSYTLGGDTLPSGLSFNTTTGVLSGSSSATGVYNFNVTATDNDGVSNADTFTIYINAPVAVDAASVVGAPTLTSTTKTTINTTPGVFTDTDGVQNVTVKLYSDAGLTTLVGTNASGDFTGLTSGTAYYVVTTGEAKNGATNAWVVKTSSTLNVSTVVDLPELTSFNWIGTTPDTKNTSYTGLIIETNVNISSADSLVSTNGGAISNVVLLSGNRVQFDWAGTNTADTFFNLTGTALDGDQTIASEKVLLVNEAPESWQIISDMESFEGSGTQTELIASLSALVNNYEAGSIIELELVVSGGASSGEVVVSGNRLVHISGLDINNETHTYKLKVTDPSSNITYSNNFDVLIKDNF